MAEKIIVDSATMERTMTRLAHEIIERHPNSEEFYLVGIKRRGVPIAKKIGEYIHKFSGNQVFLGELDIAFYRDDVTVKYDDPHLNAQSIPFNVLEKDIILIDDVMYTGRTARAAMEALIALGRPSKIELLVMVDRGHRELPISANYVGKNIPTARTEFVSVRVEEYDGVNEVALSEKRV